MFRGDVKELVIFYFILMFTTFSCRSWMVGVVRKSF
jgi:hypothetical protein